MLLVKGSGDEAGRITQKSIKVMYNGDVFPFISQSLLTSNSSIPVALIQHPDMELHGELGGSVDSCTMDHTPQSSLGIDSHLHTICTPARSKPDVSPVE